jgi:chromosome segregation ATPase
VNFIAKKEKKPVEDIPEEENVITPEEFEQLEKKEKKGKLGFLKSKPKAGPPRRESIPRGRGDEEDLVMSVERIQAKIETIEDLRQATEEKISRLSEEIGELRSSILERDKTFNRVEGGFERVKEIFEELQPKKIRAELDKREDETEKIGAKVESFESRISEMKKNIAEVVSIMEKIKDIKNVIAVSETIGRKMAKIEEDKKDMAKTAARVESMFSELTEKMSEFHNYRDKIEFSSESMHDMMKSMDMVEVKLDNALTKDDMKKVDDRFDQMENDLSDKIQTIRDIVDDLVNDLKKGGVKDLLAKQGKSRIDEINRRLSEINDYEKGLNSLRQDFAKLREEKEKGMKTLLLELERLRAARPAIQPSPRQDSRKKPSRAAAQSIQAAREYVPQQPAREPEEMEYPDQPRPREEAQPAEEMDVIQLMEQCHSEIDSGNIEQARQLYQDVLSLYEQSKGTPQARQLYGRLKRLYYRLQIYA